MTMPSDRFFREIEKQLQDGAMTRMAMPNPVRVPLVLLPQQKCACVVLDLTAYREARQK